MRSLSLQLTGMTCDHCASNLEAALNALPGVRATVSFAQGVARVQSDAGVTSEDLLTVIAAKGFGATVVETDVVEAGVLETNEAARVKNSTTPLHVVIVGTGSGGFAAAIKAVELGARVTIIEAGAVIGGTCVNTGCVPSKILIRGAQVAHMQAHHAVEGVALHTPVLNRKAMVAQQQQWVANLRYAKYERILKTHPGITLLRGSARFLDANTLGVRQADGTELRVMADRILLAVGASAYIPEIPGLAETPYWTSNHALVAESVPRHLIVLGGSVIALELAQAFRHLCAEVTIIARSSLLSTMDPALGEGVQQVFAAEGLQVLPFTRLREVRHGNGQFIVDTANGEVRGDQLLVATGRQPNSAALELNQAGIITNARGAIVTDAGMRTNVENIYAVGDCTNQPQFVYVAAAAGSRAARNMLGEDVALDLSVLPTVVFTHPQVATVGMTAQQAEAAGIAVESRSLDLSAVPRALANFDTRGFIKLVAAAESGKILGCQVLAAEGGEVIQTAALAIRNQMTLAQLADQLFPYLTMVEGLKLCAQTFTQDIAQLSCCAG